VTPFASLLFISLLSRLVESELHDCESTQLVFYLYCMLTCALVEGTTQRLSNFWIPLEEYTKVTMDGLVRGDPYVLAGRVVDEHKKFEEGKLELAEKMYAQFKAMTQK
jgi:hypothetical protein